VVWLEIGALPREWRKSRDYDAAVIIKVILVPSKHFSPTLLDIVKAEPGLSGCCESTALEEMIALMSWN